MFGSFIAGAIKVVTFPLDAVESAADVVTGGDGSKASKKSSDLPRLSEIRDGVVKEAEELDD